MRIRIGAVLASVAVAASVVTLSAAPAAADAEVRPAVAPAADGVRQLSTSAPCAVQGDLEGKFVSSSEMPAYLECVLPAVEEWIDASYQGIRHPRAYNFVPVGVRGGLGCPYDSGSLQYCTGSETIYLGEEAVWQQYTRHGDAAPVMIVAHEVTHHFQNVAGMPPAVEPNDQIRYENQADCGAGAFMNRAHELGMTNVVDDVRDLAGSLVAAAEMESERRTHGTVRERLASFGRGSLTPRDPALATCVRYVPERPIVVVP